MKFGFLLLEIKAIKVKYYTNLDTHMGLSAGNELIEFSFKLRNFRSFFLFNRWNFLFIFAPGGILFRRFGFPFLHSHDSSLVNAKFQYEPYSERGREN